MSASGAIGAPALMAARDDALDHLLNRILAAREACGTAWPYYADPDSGAWQTVPDGDWCAGHWIECLRIAGELLGRDDLIDEALSRTRDLRPKAERHDMFRAPKFYYSAARLAETTGDTEMRALALDVAGRMRAMAIPVNGGMAIGREVQVLTTTLSGPNVVAVDNVHPNLMLDWWAARATGDPQYHDGARRHLDLTMRDFIRHDGSTIEFIEYDWDSGAMLRHFTLLGAHDDSCWSRGQAWAIGGYLRAWEELGTPEYLAAARRLFDFYTEHSGPDRVPPWDFLDATWTEGDPVDTSAAAIVAAQLARLAVLPSLPPEAAFFADQCDAFIDGLCRHLTPVSSNDRRPQGMLVDGCFNHVKRFANRHELIWGDFYLLEALYCLQRGGLPC